MKKILFTVFTFFIFFCSQGQMNTANPELVQYFDNQEPINKSVFINPNSIHPMKMVSSNNWRQIWNDKEDTISFIYQIYDIRLSFETKKKAKKFNKKFLDFNSEGGTLIKDHPFIIDEGVIFYFFDAKDTVNNILEMAGMHANCILMVVDNYFVKIYFTRKQNKPLTSFQPIINQAINNIKNIQK